VTGIPILAFASAARKLPLATLGFVQYLSPTMQLLIAVLWLGEPFGASRAVAFAFIWSGVALYAWGVSRRRS
jgi:chloramphenicol-sensitive protein RarD